MILWLRVHRVVAIASGLILMLTVLALAGDGRVPMPNLLAGDLQAIPLALIIPLIPAALLVWGLNEGLPELEAIACRPVRAARAALTMAVVVFASLGALVLAAGDHQSQAPACVRNLAAFIGMSIICGHFVGQHAATAIPAGHVFVIALTGAPPGAEPPWMWPLAGSANLVAAGMAGGLLGAGLLVLAVGAGDRAVRNS